MDIKEYENIARKHIYKDNQAIKFDNKAILKDLDNKVSIRTIENWNAKLDKNKIYEEECKDDMEFKSTLSIDADGNHLVVDVKAMTDEQRKSKRHVMEAFGYDPDEWVVINCESNFYSIESKEKRLNNYQFKLKVKPKDIKDIHPDDMKYILKELKVKPIKIPKVQQSNSTKALEVDFADMHIGSTQQNTEMLFARLTKIKNVIDSNKVKKLYLCFLGDILHVDNVSETTNKGTQLKLQYNAYEMVRSAINIVTNIIRELSIIETEIYWVQGNHSRLAEFMLFQIIEKEFKGNKHIKFNIDERSRKAFLFGNNLVGLMHGDMPNKNKDKWLQFEYAELWGRARSWEIHSGHIHSETAKMSGSLIIRTVPTPKSQDDYEYALGYGNDYTRIQTFIWDEQDGLEQINYV